MRREDSTREERWQLADYLAAENLPKVNEMCATVHPKRSFYTRYGKRMLDIVLSGLALLVTLPINLVVGIITYFDVGAPIFFKQERHGMNENRFSMIKFRNMRNTTDENGDLLPPDQRVTKFGKFVRRTSIDELLNFWSVFKGDMSLIGPRPLVTEYLERYNKRHRMRLAVRPGLECPPRKIPDKPVSWQDQFENDIWYVENVSFLVDCYMFIQLFRIAIDSKATAVRATGKRGIFMGYDLNGTAISLEEIDDDTIARYMEQKKATV